MLGGAPAKGTHSGEPPFALVSIRRLHEPDQALSNRTDTTEPEGVLLRMWVKVPTINKCRHLHRRNHPTRFSAQCFSLGEVRRESQTFIGLGVWENEGRAECLFKKSFQQSRHCTIPDRIEHDDMIGSCQRVLYLSNRFWGGSALEIVATSRKREVEPSDIDGHDLMPCLSRSCGVGIRKRMAEVSMLRIWMSLDDHDMLGACGHGFVTQTLSGVQSPRQEW